MSLYVCPAAVLAARSVTVREVLRNIPSDSGWLVEHLMMSELQRGPGESLMQLKAAAERFAGLPATGSRAPMDNTRASA